LFTGTYEHSIDAKQRLAIPSEIREALQPDRDGDKLYLSVANPHALSLYTQAGFERRADDLEQSPLPPADVIEFERVFYSLARPVELDKQGRIRLPEQLVNFVKLGREVVLLGVKDHLEIHDRQRWYEQLTATLASKPNLLANPRQFAQPQGRETGGDR
jgi:MraZ protein